jgi:arsenate reductase
MTLIAHRQKQEQQSPAASTWFLVTKQKSTLSSTPEQRDTALVRNRARQDTANAKETRQMEITIYHNPACGTSLNALAAIRAAGHEPRIFEYLRTPLSPGAIKALVDCMNVPIRSIIRSKEPLFRELGLDERDVTESELLGAMAENPILINRPIVVVKSGTTITARLCRPSETVKSLLTEAGANT